jgi:SAM-dependent methyltransferase
MDKQPENPPEFDSYAQNYAELIRDPLRQKFTASDRFFAERKIQVIQRYYKTRGVDTRSLAWLDVGCGHGELLRLGKSHFAAATGTDPSAKMLEACSDLQVFQQPSPDRLPFADKSFDLITAVCVYHHVPESERLGFTKEILRLLRPNGVFCLIEHNPLNPLTKLIVSRTPVDADARLLTAREARNLFSSAGCSILDTQYFLFLPERIHRYLGALEDRLSRIPLGGQYCMMCACRS